MLDDLKKEQVAGAAAKERAKLSIYVGGMLLLGTLIFYMAAMGGSLGSGRGARDADDTKEAKSGEPPPPLLDGAELERRVAASKAEPGHWSVAGIEYVRRIRKIGRIPPVEARLTAAQMWDLDAAKARGRSLDVQGKVVSVSRETYGATPGDDSGRLWSVILEGKDGKRVVAVSYSMRSEVAEGPPADTRPPYMSRELIAPGQYVIARGVYLQRRTGTLGGVRLQPRTPTLFAFHYRIVVAPDLRNPLIGSLDDALWSEVKDRFNRESRKWDEDALFEVIQWARAKGYEACKEAVLHGDIGWKEWGSKRFDAWKKEVRVGEDDPRPVTESSRGKVFRLSGIIGEVLDFGWERIPRNPWGVDEFQSISLLADRYRNVSLRVFLPYPISTCKGVKGVRKEHVYIYGVFIKNFTYDTKFKEQDGSGRMHPVTVPMFVVLHAEPYPEDLAERRMRRAMLWVAAGMLVFGFLFYFVLIRGGRRQNREMEAHRLALRRRVRARGQAPSLPHDDAGPPDGAGGAHEEGADP
jgi:hypothetical protein